METQREYRGMLYADTYGGLLRLVIGQMTGNVLCVYGELGYSGAYLQN